MAVKILIKRTVPENKAKEMIPLFRQMRVLATNQSGYISGETLKSLDRLDTFLVISTWKSSEYWEKWLLSKERQGTQDEIDALLGGKTEYESHQFFSQRRGTNSRHTGVFTIKMNPLLYGQIK